MLKSPWIKIIVFLLFMSNFFKLALAKEIDLNNSNIIEIELRYEVLDVGQLPKFRTFDFFCSITAPIGFV